MVMLNLIFRAGVKNSLHPWMGTRVKKNILDHAAPVITGVLTHPSVKKISRIIRYAEGRIVN
jgi:hypothetical protein